MLVLEVVRAVTQGMESALHGHTTPAQPARNRDFNLQIVELNPAHSLRGWMWTCPQSFQKEGSPAELMHSGHGKLQSWDTNANSLSDL